MILNSNYVLIFNKKQTQLLSYTFSSIERSAMSKIIIFILYLCFDIKQIRAYNVEGRYDQRFVKALKSLETGPDEEKSAFEDSIFFGNVFETTTYKNSIMLVL